MHSTLAKLSVWHPPVGVFIAVLAVLGVIVPWFRAWSNIRKWERAFWTILMFVLVGLEIRSIYSDQTEHDKQQAEARARELERFSQIAGGIKTAINNSQH
jgi:protein-S-isoprenylcysteine O-methyltransferase Ste14